MADSMVLSPAEKKQIEPLMRYLLPDIIKGKKEIVINKPGEIGFEDFDGNWEFKEAPELSFEVLTTVMNLLAERNNVAINAANPILSCKMPGGHRAQFVGGLQNPNKFSLTIRLFQDRTFGLESFQFKDEDRQAVIDAVRGKKTILISGGTGSGKTSFMNSLLQFIAEDERLVTIEDVRELKVKHRNWVSFVFANSKGDDQKNINDLLNATLRMRPDRILLGEVRKENAFTFCSAINTGHKGSMATIHANDPKSAIDAVLNRVLLNGDINEEALAILRRQLLGDIYGVVQLNRVKGGVEGYFETINPQKMEASLAAESGGNPQPQAQPAPQVEPQPIPEQPAEKPQQKPVEPDAEIQHQPASRAEAVPNDATPSASSRADSANIAAKAAASAAENVSKAIADAIAAALEDQK